MINFNLEEANRKLNSEDANSILKWAFEHFKPGELCQLTAFGLTGIAQLELTLNTINSLKNDSSFPNIDGLDLIFIDTLYHFKETYELVEKIRNRYPNLRIHIFKPEGCENVKDFEEKYGKELWKKDEDKYDYLIKIEPTRRAYKELKVKAVLTGRRRSQGGKRSEMPIIELEKETGIYKINTLANWSFSEVKSYVETNKLAYNELLDKGYTSVGDWHSTEPSENPNDERGGRWKGREKTECGIHEQSRFAQYLKSKQVS